MSTTPHIGPYQTSYPFDNTQTILSDISSTNCPSMPHVRSLFGTIAIFLGVTITLCFIIVGMFSVRMSSIGLWWLTNRRIFVCLGTFAIMLLSVCFATLNISHLLANFGNSLDGDFPSQYLAEFGCSIQFGSLGCVTGASITQYNSYLDYSEAYVFIVVGVWYLIGLSLYACAGLCCCFCKAQEKETTVVLNNNESSDFNTNNGSNNGSNNLDKNSSESTLTQSADDNNVPLQNMVYTDS